MIEEPNLEVIKELSQKTILWFRLSQLYMWMHWIIGILGVLFSTLATSALIEDKWHIIFSTAAAICISIVGFINPQKWGATYIRAYRILEPAIREYFVSLITLKVLLDIHKVAEEILNSNEQVSSPQVNPQK